jgi:uroporphyrinogen decarboxylase
MIKPILKRKPDKERLRAALLGQEVDCIPYWENTVMGRAIRFVFEEDKGTEISWFLSLEDQRDLAIVTGQDILPAGGGFVPAPRIKEKDGSYRILKEGELTSWDLLDKLVPYTNDEIYEGVKRSDHGFEIIEGTGLGLWGCAGAIFQGAWQLVGFNDFMIKSIEDPDFIYKLVEYLAAPQVTAAEMMCEYPLTLWGIGDNISTTKGPFLDPGFFKTIWNPWVEKILAPAQDKNIPVFINTDGRIDWILDDFIAMGVDATNPVDPNGNDIFEVHEKYGDKLCIIGGINQFFPLAQGMPEDVDKEVKMCIERLSGNGGYIVASSHDIGDNVPPENWVAMIKAVEKYG